MGTIGGTLAKRLPTAGHDVAVADSREAVIIDTSDYSPARDERIAAIEDGQPESAWVQEQLSRPIVKAWNAVGWWTLVDHALQKGHPDRIGLPVAGDDPRAKEVAFGLMNQSGFDPVDSGSIAESWRQQPGSPAYCTALRTADVPAALRSAQRERLPTLRDFAAAIQMERMSAPGVEVPPDFAVRLNRLVST